MTAYVFHDNLFSVRYVLKYSHTTPSKGGLAVQDAPGIQNAYLFSNKEINPLNKEKKI